MTDDERTFLDAELATKLRWFNSGSRNWSALHHWSLGVSAFLSALSVVVLKINWLKSAYPSVYENREDIVAALVFAATLITAVSAAGSFGQKWQTNRVSRGRIQRLQIAMSDPSADAAVIRRELQDAIRSHDEGIIGTSVK
jgi:hypothetical protein